MADYQLTATDEQVIRTADQAWIPNDEANRDWVEYEKWLEAGGVPDPYVPPAKGPPMLSATDAVLFDHENRIREQEGVPPLTVGDFLTKMRAGP